jgi:hypothetical protein
MKGWMINTQSKPIILPIMTHITTGLGDVSGIIGGKDRLPHRFLWQADARSFIYQAEGS